MENTQILSKYSHLHACLKSEDENDDDDDDDDCTTQNLIN